MIILFSLTSLLAVVGLGAGCDSRSPRQPNDDAARTAAAPQQKTAPSAGCGGRLVFGDSVGPIRLGMSLDALRRACPIVHDTTVPTAYGPAERRLSVLLGPDTAVVTIHIGRVGEILLASGAFHTTDSVGIGTPLRVLLARPLVEGYGVAGELLVQTPSECGLTFGIAGRYPDLPDRVKDSATMARVPLTAVVDRIRIDGCERDEDARFSASDDSTYDVQTDSVMLARDLDGNGLTDYVVRESRPTGSMRVYSFRLVVYLDSMPAGRRARWSSGWDMEGEATLGEVASLGSRGSMLAVYGNEADYTSETLLAIRDGSITEELTHGEDYGAGFLELGREGGTLVVDASQMHLLVRGAPVSPELECKDGNWPAVRMRWDDANRRFLPEKPRCIKARWPGEDAKPSTL
ncbi:MAG TPA: hypothetical protein VFD67_10750 [Gemmatimonadaceae bacterium]|nr:hypothetical protein [Gemmatimonadaceae bacterium]